MKKLKKILKNATKIGIIFNISLLFIMNLQIKACFAGSIIDVIKNNLTKMNPDLPGKAGAGESGLRILNPVAITIKYLMGLLGVLFFILVIYAGILWMTAAGEDDKINKSKKILTSSVIGLAIIFGGYLISYVIVAILDAAK